MKSELPIYAALVKLKALKKEIERESERGERDRENVRKGKKSRSHRFERLYVVSAALDQMKALKCQIFSISLYPTLYTTSMVTKKDGLSV